MIKRLFNIAALSVIPFWILVVFFPFWGITQTIMQSVAIVAAPLIVYGIIALPKARGLVLLLFHRDVFERYVRAMATPGGAVLMWAHVSAFDLFAGRYIYFDALSHSLSWLWVGPVLLLTMLAGPIGLGTYFIVSGIIANMPK